MDFDIFSVIFFLIWVGLLLKAIFGIFGRNRSRRAPPEETEKEPQEQMPQDPPQPERQNTSQEDTAGGYDYKALRKKILDSWQVNEDKKEKDLPDEMEKPVYKEKQAEEPKPVAAPVFKKPMKPTVAVSASIRADEEKVRRMAAYAARTAGRTEPAKETVLAVSEAPKRRRMSEKDVEQWAVYDAVFGKPRALHPWRPGR